jgi:Flp pilus assembly protein CpaB
VVGGLLVAAAVLLAWWAASTAGRPPTTRYVAAVGSVGPGEVIERDDLTLVVAELPPDVRGRVFSDPASVVGRVALGPIGTGELVAAGSITDDAPPTGERELTFPVSAAWALDGDLRPGDRIDVFATYGDGVSSQTLRILAGATVRRTTEADGTGLGDRAGPTVTVGVSRDVSVETVVNATHAASLTVVRVTADPGDTLDPTADRYRADADLAGTGLADPVPTDPTEATDAASTDDPAAGP